MADSDPWLATNKGLWARVYDEVIKPEIEKEWKKRSEDREKELKMKDEHHQILSNHVSNELVKNAQLKEENARLKRLLQKQNRGITPSAEEVRSNTDGATIPVEEYRQITDKYDELNKRYQDAAQRIKYLERKNVAVMQKNKDMKDSVKAWQEYCDRHIGKKMKSEERTTKAPPKNLAPIETHELGPSVPSSPVSTTFVRTPRSLVAQDRSSPAPMIALSRATLQPQNPDATDNNEHVNARDQMEADIDPVHRQHVEDGEEGERAEQVEDVSPPLPTTNLRGTTSSSDNDRIAFLGQPGSDKLGSSQTTEDEVAEQNHETTARRADAMTDDDVPQFVSERSLKRKRKPSAGFRIYTDGSSDGTPAKPVRVKEEQYRSPPPESAIHQLLRKETMDLDELGPNAIMTPRRALRRVNTIHSNTIGALRNQRSNSAPFSGNLIKSEPSEEAHVAEARPRSFLAIEMEDTRAVSEPGDAIREPGNALQPLDPNVLVKRIAEGAPKKRMKREEARKKTEFNILAESGAEPPPVNERRKRPPPNLAREHFNERIRVAKGSPSPKKNALATPKTAPAKTRTAQIPTPPSSTNRPYTPCARPPQRKAPATDLRPDARARLVLDGQEIWRMGPPGEPARKAPAPPQSREQVPLRDKPFAELRIQDFKPNPSYNQGYSYAFSETVRKRTDRLCLPGCTNPACCGSTFRTLASAAASLTSSQEEKLLQEYLGDAYDSFGLTQMSQDERKEIVLQARTRKMATEHGKHRQAYEGRRTPPGFWRIDFPNTQEQEEDREKAQEMEMAQVQKRWLEAMRRGGKWIFRDE